MQRVELDCAALAGPMAGAPASAADAAEIAARLNAFHGAEELFVPYTAESFATRVERAPDLYGWDKVWLTDGATRRRLARRRRDEALSPSSAACRR